MLEHYIKILLFCATALCIKMPCHHQILPLKMTPRLLGRISIRRRSFSWSRIWKISLNLIFHLLKERFGSLMVFLGNEMGWIITHHKIRTTGRSGTFFTAFILSRGGLELTNGPQTLPFSQNYSLHPGESSGRALKLDSAPEHPSGAGTRAGNFPREAQSSTSKPISVPRIQEHMGGAHFSELFPIYAPNLW